MVMYEPDKQERAFYGGFRNATIVDLENVLRTALTLERKLYSREDTTDALFCLRKSLEAIWGHDLP